MDGERQDGTISQGQEREEPRPSPFLGLGLAWPLPTDRGERKSRSEYSALRSGNSKKATLNRTNTDTQLEHLSEARFENKRSIEERIRSAQ